MCKVYMREGQKKIEGLYGNNLLEECSYEKESNENKIYHGKKV